MKLLLLVLIIFSCKAESQKIESGETEVLQKTEVKTKMQISSRVDTTNIEVKEVLELYENYINSQPDSIYDNPYWNSEEKARFKDFDFSRINIFNGISSSQLFILRLFFQLNPKAKNIK